MSDYYAPGAWNVICDRCGAKRKSFEVQKEWNGLLVCREHWEPRHPQEFVRGRRDKQSVPAGMNRPEADDVFLATNEVTAESL